MILFEKKYQTFDTVFHHQMKHLEVRQILLIVHMSWLYHSIYIAIFRSNKCS